MEEPVTVAIVHGSVLVREGIGELLQREPGFHVVGTFGSAQEVLQWPYGTDHVLLYDLGTARRDGAPQVKELHDRLPQLKILMFNVVDDTDTIVGCVATGASGCILQDASLQELLGAVRSVWRGTPALSPRCITSLFAYVARLRAGEGHLLSMHLTKREEQILELIAEGLSNKEIARRLYLQPQTVKNYVHQILQKLDLHSRLDVIKLLRTGRH